jgi:hypothetical protein
VTEDLSPRLEQRIINPHAEVDITDAEFNALKASRKVLSDALGFEQRYELLLGNYLEFEVGATRLSLEAVSGMDYRTYLPGAKALLEGNRLLMNVMTASRTYIDQVKHDFKGVELEPGFGAAACELLSVQFDASFDYRFMEALRNHAQHRGMPAHGYSSAEGLHNALTFRSMKRELIDAGDFKKSVLNEMPEQVDLRQGARRYVECLSAVHVALRALVLPFIERARRDIELAIDRYKAKNHGQALGLHAHRAVNGVEEWVGLMVEWDDVRMHLANKNDAQLRFTARFERNGTHEDEP